jgi:phosphoribosylanthranilate isomerase
MALSTLIKISGVTNLSDARYCAGMFVDLLGFDLQETSDKFVSPTQFQEISGWVSGVDFCGEFGNDSLETLQEKLKKYPEISWIQHNKLETLLQFDSEKYQLIFQAALSEVRHIEEELAEKISNQNLHLLLSVDQTELNTDQKESIRSISKKAKVILAGGISPFNVKSTVSELDLFGIALEGGEEIKPGLKDFDTLAEILEELELED